MAAAWLVGGLASVALTARAWVAVRPSAPTAAPPPLPRPPTPAEQQSVAHDVERMQAEIDAARARLGRVLRLDELEAVGPDGRPYLPGGLADNPLVEGTAGTAASCPGDPRPPALDWLYCPETGTLRAGVTSPTSP